MEHRIIEESINKFEEYLRREERAEHTITKYLHNLRMFSKWMQDGVVSKEKVSEWKSELHKAGMAAVTINTALAALHSFFYFIGKTVCGVLLN